MNLTLTLAWRYLKTSTGNNIRSIIGICFLSIMLSSAILLLVLSIMTGFEQATYQQLRGLHADLIIEAPPQSFLNMKKIGAVLSAEYPQLNWSPSSAEYVIVANQAYHPISTGVVLKAIDPLKEQQTSNLNESITQPSNAPLSKLIQNNSIVMGQKLAELLEVCVGSSLTLTYNLGSSYSIHDLQQETVHVAALFKTGIEEYDTQLLYCSATLMEKLFPNNSITQINIKIPSSTLNSHIKQDLQQRLKLPVLSWKDLYPALVAALKLETYALCFIVSLICLMALFNITSVLFMLIRNKRRDIAILKTLGLDNAHLKKIFLIIGMSITTSACFIGLSLGGLVAVLLNKYPLFDLPESYVVKHLPIHLEPAFFYILFISILLASFLVTWLSARKATSIGVTHVLRFEG